MSQQSGENCRGVTRLMRAAGVGGVAGGMSGTRGSGKTAGWMEFSVRIVTEIWSEIFVISNDDDKPVG